MTLWKKAVLPLMLLFLLMGAKSVSALDLSDVPLEVQPNAAQPNLMIILDNSDSMRAEFLTAEPDGLFEQHRYLFAQAIASSRQPRAGGQALVLPEDKRRLWKSQWHGYNKLYYHAGINYSPWVGTRTNTFAQADLNRPWCDPMQTRAADGRLCLARPFMQVRVGQALVAIANAHYFVVKDGNHNGKHDRGEPVYLVTWIDADQDLVLDVSGNSNDDRRLYLRFLDDGDGRLEDHELSLVTSQEEKNGVRPAWIDAQGQFQGYQSDLEDLQNFANWFSYYRCRGFCLKAAVGSVMDKLEKIQVGLYAVNGQPRIGVRPISGDTPGEAADTGSKRADTLRDDLRHAVYNLSFGGETPLRSALDAVGRYYHQARSSSLGPSPYASADQGGGCQPAHALILTDGFDEASFSGIGNADGDNGSPFADPWLDTLADVAMEYYENDLAPQLADMHPGHGCDDARHQHLVTHCVSFGPAGTLKMDDMDADGRLDSPAYGQDPCFRNQATPHPEWPDPVPGTPAMIDDVWHAAVNGRGLYDAAWDSVMLEQAVEQAIGRIQEGAQVRADTVVSGFATGASVLVQSSYRSQDWSGDLAAYRFDSASERAGDAKGALLWQASAGPADVPGASDAIPIVSYGGIWRDPTGIPFQYLSFSDAQRVALGSDLVPGSAQDRDARSRLEYLRGAVLAQFRQRDHLLGDIVHGTPLIAGDTVFAGANDGMLHAFALQDGSQRFAYIPNLVFDHLAGLSRSSYPQNHRFFVDGPLYAGEVLVGPFHRATYLVGALGKGGKGCYCLWLAERRRTRNGDEYGDYVNTFSVDDLDSGCQEHAISRIVKWEYPRPEPDDDGMDNNGNGRTDEPGEHDPDMGYGYGRAFVVNANAPDDSYCPVVILGNGYDSEDQKAVLYILDADKGTLLRKIDTGVAQQNGLSSPALVDVDMDRRVDYAYAGDLRGNLWKFDLTAELPQRWGVAYGRDANGDGVIDAAAGDVAYPLFRTRQQAITTRPNVMRMHSQCGPQLPGFMVLFGTGRYLGLSDRRQSHADALYGIWDYGDDDDDSEIVGFFPEGADERLSTGLVLVRQQIVGQTSDQGRVIRVLSDRQPQYETVEDTRDEDGSRANNHHGKQNNNPAGVVGWYLEFPATSAGGARQAERIIQDMVLRDGNVIVASYVPDAEPCSCGGYSWLYLLGGCSGLPSKDEAGEAILPQRLCTAVAGSLLVTKPDPRSARDILWFADCSGRLSSVAFQGEKWGKRYWRENLRE